VVVLALLLLDDFTLLLLVEEEVEALTMTIEALLEVLLVEDTVFPTLLDLTLAYTNCVSPISQVLLILNDSKTMLSIAFKLAPEKEFNGLV
jgi:hypothetical protein